MTLAHDLLLDFFGRIAEGVPRVLDGLTSDDLAWQPGTAANPIGWLLWHLCRVEDLQMADVASKLGSAAPQVWHAQGFDAKFGLPYGDGVGYGHTAEQVAAFSLADPGLLADYYAAVHATTKQILANLDDDAYASIVDTRWDPPVTAAVRLVSIVDDVTKHLGQAEYVKGLLQRRES